ncbi:MAG: lysophospholipid acyltransferase family protein [Acidimicrobiales bacterium]|jgi:1-acyl-sn-glycerol-3-phosphate acyltransferase|nr:lysophospholipid acyltransferase family protein [Acidimicrobiales bacterium]
MAAPPRPLIRRPISITILTIAVSVSVALTPIVVPVLAIVDTITRQAFRRSRGWMLYVGVLVNEAGSLASAAALITWHLGRLDRDLSQARFHRLEWRWARRHIVNLRWFSGLRWVVENPGEMRDGKAIVLARHASHADSILPLLLFGVAGHHEIRYTLKDDLQWLPAMDIVGNLLPNVFINRAPTPDSPLWDEMRELAAGLDRGVAVIFPEGTFYTPERLDRAALRLAEGRPDLEAPARSLEHILPPRPAGTEALLAGAPEADLILVAHEGMEAFSDLASIRQHLPLRTPVRVRLWRIPRDEVPTDDLAGWLLDRWIDLDRWIQKGVIERRDSDGTPPSLIGAQEIHV